MRLFFLLLSFFLWGQCNPPSQQNAIESPSVPDYSFIKPNRYNVAFLVMNGTYNTELTAPYDIFQHTQFRDSIKPMNVFMVADTRNPIKTFEGIKLFPHFDYTKDSLPPIDILVVPSAEHHLDTDLENKILIDFVKKTADKAQYVTSHCDGAFILAKSGVLDGKVCTTFPSDIDKFKAMFSQLDVRKDVLFVHDGKFITSVGGAKSFEAALYLTDILYGKAVSKRLAQGLVIDWNVDNIKKVIVQK